MSRKLQERMYDLVAEHDSRGSFYGKAKVEVKNGETTLYSYNTPIIKYDSNGKLYRLCDVNLLSSTTMRHLREFIQQAIEDGAVSDIKKISKDWFGSLPQASVDESLKKRVNENIENLETTETTTVVNQPTGAAKEESKTLWDRFMEATKEPEDAPLFGAKDQPVPEKPVEPKITLDESLFLEATDNFVDEGELSDKIYDAVNDVFAHFQNKLGIKYGDIAPEDDFELEEIENSLANLILKVLKYQKFGIDDEDNYEPQLTRDDMNGGQWYESLNKKRIKENYSIVDLDTGDSFGNFDSADSAKSKAQRYSQQCKAKCAVVDDRFNVVCGYVDGKERRVTESLKRRLKNRKNESLNKKYIKTKNTPKKLLKEALITSDFSNYRPWSGAVDTYRKIEEEGLLDSLESMIDELYDGVIGETELNDLLWFDSDYVFEYLGISNEDDEDMDESLNEGKRGFLRKYNGCSIHDAGDTYVVTNENGLNIGQSKTEIGAEAIIDEYLKKNNRNLKEKMTSPAKYKVTNVDWFARNDSDWDKIDKLPTEFEIVVDEDLVEEGNKDIYDNNIYWVIDQAIRDKFGVRASGFEFEKVGEKNLKEEVSDIAYQMAEEIDDRFKAQGFIAWDDFNEAFEDAYPGLIDWDDDSFNDLETDVRGILSYMGWETIYEGEDEGGLKLLESKSIKGKKNLKEASTLSKGGKDKDFDIDEWSVIYWELSGDSEGTSQSQKLKKNAKVVVDIKSRYDHVDPVNKNDIRVYAKDENGFDLAKKVADAHGLKYKIEPTNKTHAGKNPNEAFQMTLYIPDEMVG